MKNSEKQSIRDKKEKEKNSLNEQKRLLFNSIHTINSKTKKKTKLFQKSQPKTEFTITAIGIAKRESGKYKSRWRNSDE